MRDFWGLGVGAAALSMMTLNILPFPFLPIIIIVGGIHSVPGLYLMFWHLATYKRAVRRERQM